MPAHSGEGGGAELEAVQEAVRALVRAVRTLRTYPVDNQMSVRALSKLEEQLQEAPNLDLEVRAEHLCWRGELLLRSDAERTDLPGNLYKDGIRRVHLQQGIEREELQRLVLALATPIHPHDFSEDYVTRLWEANLPHVRVAALDPYLDLDLPDEVLEGNEKPNEELEELAPQASVDAPPPPDEAFQVNPPDARRIAEEVEQAMALPPWGNFIAAVFDILAETQRRSRIADLVSLLEQTFQRVLGEGRIEFAISILKHLRGRVPAAAAAELRQALTRMVQTERLAGFHRALEAEACDFKEAESMLLLLGPRVTDSLCALLVTAKQEATRRFYADVLVKIGKVSVEPVLEHFASSEGEVKVHFASILGRLRAPRATRLLLAALDTRDFRLRRELVRSLAMLPDERAREKLLEIGMQDSDSICRGIALRGLGQAQKKLDAKRLLGRIRSRAFASLSDEEKDLLFVALGRAGGEEGVDYLTRCLQPSWIPGTGSRENRQRAALGLAQAGTPAAIELLEKLARGRRVELAAVCREALQTVRREKE